jgi:hypothetical protein
MREKYCWLVAGGWFVLREKYYWLVADKPNVPAGVPARMKYQRQKKHAYMRKLQFGIYLCIYGYSHTAAALMKVARQKLKIPVRASATHARSRTFQYFLLKKNKISSRQTQNIIRQPCCYLL